MMIRLRFTAGYSFSHRAATSVQRYNMTPNAGLAAVSELVDHLAATTALDAAIKTITLDLDATDVEAYGRSTPGCAYNYQGQHCGDHREGRSVPR